MIVVEDLELVKLQGLMNLEVENVRVNLNENYIFFLAGILESHFEDVINLESKFSQKGHEESS
jgi:hypothetical protein